MYTLRRQVGRTPLGSDRDVPDRRRAGAAAGADSAVHDGRGVAQPARRRARRRCTWHCSRSELDDWQDDALLDRWAQLSARARSGQRGARGKAPAEGDHLVAVGAGRPGGVGRAGANCWRDYRDELPAIFGVSQVDARRRLPTEAASVPDGVQVVVERADGVKCERCWRFVPSVSEAPEFKGLCDRCVDALAEPVSRSARRDRLRRRRAASRSLVVARHRRRRPGHEGAGAAVARAAREHADHSGRAGADPRAQHRRRVRDAQRDGVSGQDDRADAGGDAGAGRRRLVRRVRAGDRSARAAGRRHAFSAARSAT